MLSQTKCVLQNTQWERLFYNINSGAKFYVVLNENIVTKDNDNSGFVVILL